MELAHLRCDLLARGVCVSLFIVYSENFHLTKKSIHLKFLN